MSLCAECGAPMHPQAMTCGSCGASTAGEHRFDEPDESEGFTLGDESSEVPEDRPTSNGAARFAAHRAKMDVTSPRPEPKRPISRPSGAPAFFARGFALAIDVILVSLTKPLLSAVALAATGLAAAFGAHINDKVALAAHLTSAGGLALAAGYFILFQLAPGQTIGKALLGLRVVRLDGAPLNVGQSALRVLGYGLSFLTLGFGFLLAVSPPYRALHDHLAGSIVIRARKSEETRDDLEQAE